MRPSFGCQDAGFRINETAPAIAAKTASMIRPPATASTKWWGAKAASLRSGEPRASLYPPGQHRGRAGDAPDGAEDARQIE